MDGEDDVRIPDLIPLYGPGRPMALASIISDNFFFITETKKRPQRAKDAKFIRHSTFPNSTVLLSTLFATTGAPLALLIGPPTLLRRSSNALQLPSSLRRGDADVTCGLRPSSALPSVLPGDADHYQLLGLFGLEIDCPRFNRPLPIKLRGIHIELKNKLDFHQDSNFVFDATNKSIDYGPSTQVIINCIYFKASVDAIGRYRC
ncbi:hypothetical protein LXL04_038190 [Taraxacum kok-saghyz]